MPKPTFSDRLNESWLWDIEEFNETLQQAYLPRCPIVIHVVGMTNEGNKIEEDASRPNNQWLFYLELQPSQNTGKRRALSFKPMSGEDSEYAGSIHLKMLLDRPHTSRIARIFSIPFLVPVPMQTIIEFMMEVGVIISDFYFSLLSRPRLPSLTLSSA